MGLGGGREGARLSMGGSWGQDPGRRGGGGRPSAAPYGAPTGFAYFAAGSSERTGADRRRL